MGDRGCGHLVVAGGQEQHGVTILWQPTTPAPRDGRRSRAPTGSTNGDMWDSSRAESFLYPTWDGSPVVELAVTYPPGPVGAKGQPSGFIFITGNQLDGVCTSTRHLVTST